MKGVCVLSGNPALYTKGTDMYYVQTTNGTRYYGTFNTSGDKNVWPGDEETANALVKQANAKAEKLGITTRYEVVEG